MEYIVEKTQESKKLNNDNKKQIAKKIVEDFACFDQSRKGQLDKANRLTDEIYFKSVAKVSENKEERWKSQLKMCKLFMFYQILKAFVWKNTYANTNSMFDVSGESLESDNNSNKQKTMLVDCLEKMDFPKTCDKVIDNSLLYGELISFTTWKKHTTEYRRPISFFEGIKDFSKMGKILEAKAKGENFYIDEKVDYDNPYIYAVDPANFVFDTAQFDNNWESCPKMYRTFRTPEDIINNQYYEISKEVAKELREMVKTGSDIHDLGDQKAESLKHEHTNGSTVEVIEHWGDLQLPDKTVLRNWYAVVIGGKFLVRFEKNPFLINPFTYGAYIQDPENKRGISPLYSVYDIALTQEDMLRRTMDLQALTENPPVLTPKGFFGRDTNDIAIRPGKILEYDPNLYANSKPEPIQYNVTVFENYLQYVDDLMSEISGVFPNMAGQSEHDRTTATEISTKVEGQLTRLKLLLDIINQNFILEGVKNVAKLKSNFTFGEEEVFINNENNPENVVINDEVRQAEYRYTYADRSATSERWNYADNLAQALQQFVKTGVPLNLEEIFTWYLEQKGVENPERFLVSQNMIDPQVQQALLQNPQLAPVINEMQQRVQMAKQGAELPENEPQQPQIEEQEQPIQ